jgi:benzoyl-CoA reductase/2-hydroxyglutaryl-CoA dehydratase subunit BcrC/BadD/HgdB
MAEAYTDLFINRTEAIKEQYLLDMVKAFSVDGMIFHDSKTCPNNSNARYGMPQRLEKWFDLPTLVVHGDLCDMRLVSDVQIETALEAFTERLEAQGTNG